MYVPIPAAVLYDYAVVVCLSASHSYLLARLSGIASITFRRRSSVIEQNT